MEPSCSDKPKMAMTENKDGQNSVSNTNAEDTRLPEVLDTAFRNATERENEQLLDNVDVIETCSRSINTLENQSAIKIDGPGGAAVVSSNASATFCDQDDSSTSEEHSERFIHLLKEHKRYIQRKSRERFHLECGSSNTREECSHLFDCLLLVGLTLGPNERKIPCMLTKYPPDICLPPYTEYFCFPDAEHWVASSHEQSYSLVITSEKGERKFGYCRRVLPEGSPVCLPLVYCIISRFRARGFYHKILKELESRHGEPDQILSAFITSLHNSRFPEPGHTLQFASLSNSDGDFLDMTPVLRRPHDLRLEDQDLVEAFDLLKIPVFLKVFGSLLLERKIIFLSNSFCKLSSCAEAVQSILYPFSWQHILIPVLPTSLLEICQSPTPYIVGILDDGQMHVLEALQAFEEGIIVNLDESTVLYKVGDESSALPIVLMKRLKASLELAINPTEAGPETRNVVISEAFLRVFVDTCGHYRNHILSINGNICFDCESFVNSRSSSEERPFLERFIETTMFSAFIDIRLQNELEGDIFDQRAFERSQELEHSKEMLKKGKKKTKASKGRFKFWTGN